MQPGQCVDNSADSLGDEQHTSESVTFNAGMVTINALELWESLGK